MEKRTFENVIMRCCIGSVFSEVSQLHKYRKIIGVIIARSDGDFQKKLIEGIERQAYEFNYDVLVFSPFVNEGGGESLRGGEANIYEMINFDLLDAVIFAPDTLKYPSAVEKLTSKLRNGFRKPVVTVEYEIDGIPNINSDDKTSVKKIITHLINVHKMSDIAFVTGPKEHPHSKRRLDGYFEALVENDLTIDRERVFYGDFWYSCGEGIAESLCGSARPLPQAVACASDSMAVGLSEAFKKRGIRVPEDIAVTGYDCVKSGQDYSPSITSVLLPAATTGTNAVRKIHAMLTSGEYNALESKPEIEVGRSCGCNSGFSHKAEDWRDIDYSMDFTSSHNFILEELSSETELTSFLGKIKWYTYLFKPFDSFCFCMCENWDGAAESGKKQTYIKSGYSAKMTLAVECSESVSTQDARIYNLAEMLPVIYNKRGYPTTWFFTPVHFNDRSFGYAAISYGKKVRVYDETYRMMMKYANCSLEALRRQRKLKTVARRMRESAVIDVMTGIYNRCGFNLYADEIFRTARQSGRKMLVLAGSVGKLGQINRLYGHICGDEIVISAAKAFGKACGSDRICFRTDGNTFLMLDESDYNLEQLEALKKDICTAFADGEFTKNISRAGMNFMPKLIFGTYYGGVSGFSGIEQLIAAAYDEMEAEKKRYVIQQ